MYPIKFKPVYKDYIWGGRNLESFKNDLPPGIVAESWEISGHPDGISLIKNGEYKGMLLSDLLDRYGRDILGNLVWEKTYDKFPLLVKFIDANDRLSVQVHPDDEYARKMENSEYGKNEMWYVISAKPGAKIIYDVIPGTTRETFEECISRDMIDNCLKYVEVSEGDIVNIPSGVVHAIGEGIIIAEIQQNSNLTYRVYDYDRVDKNGNKRPLHISKALDVINFESNGRKEKYEGLEINLGPEVKKSYKVSNEYFCTEIYETRGILKESTNGGKFYIYIFIEGEADIVYKNNIERIQKGETVLIPACLGEYEIHGEFKAIRTYIPDVDEDVIKPLVKAGYTMDDIKNNIGGICR